MYHVVFSTFIEQKMKNYPCFYIHEPRENNFQKRIFYRERKILLLFSGIHPFELLEEFFFIPKVHLIF